MTHIIISAQQAEAIKGKYGKYSAIDPTPLPDGNFIIPECILSDPDLHEAWDKIPQNAHRMTIEEIRELYPDFQKSDDLI